ncbi:MAG: hypothetical protein RI897_4518 [Verrucomicrobiota bacterium]|jgi:hypothetical protein
MGHSLRLVWFRFKTALVMGVGVCLAFGAS